jgi:hypothetical protein
VPNPFQEALTVYITSDQPKTQLNLMKLTGELILSQDLEGMGQFSFGLNLSFLEKGMYVLVFKNTVSGEQVTKKIVKL